MAWFTNLNNTEPEQDNVLDVDVSGFDAGTDRLDTGVITKHTRIVGDVITDGHLVVDGVVEGQITSAGDIVICESHDGDITCRSLYLENCEIHSSVNASGCVVIKETAVVQGSVNCQDISVYGTIIGDIIATGNVFLKSTAVIEGNISAATIGMENGAKISGKFITE